MKNISLSFYQKIVILSIFSLFLTTSFTFGQGWTLSVWFSAAGEDVPPRNDIVNIPAYKNGQTFPLGTFPGSNALLPQIHHVQDEYAGGVSSSSPTGSSGSTINYTPVSGLVGGLDTAIVLIDMFDEPTGVKDLFLTCYIDNNTSAPHDVLWHEPVFEDPTIDAIGADVKMTLDGHFIVLGATASELTPNENVHELILSEHDENGIQLWSKTLESPGNDQGVSLILAEDGGYWILKNVQMDLSSPTSSMWLVKTDAAGELEWETNISTTNADIAYDMVLTQHGDLVITGNNDTQNLFILKTDADGMEVWRQDYDFPMRDMIGKGIIEGAQNHLVVAGQSIMNADGKLDPFVAKITTNGTPLWEKFYPKMDQNRGFNDITLAPSGLYLMGGFNQLEPEGDSYGSYFTMSDTFGVVKGGLIQGNVFHDFNLDCSMDTDEMGLEDWVVQAVNDTLSFYANTDENGNYFLPVDAKSGTTVDYTVSVFPISSYWDICENDIPVEISYLDTLNIDFAAQALVECPFSEVELVNSNFRPCESSDIYVQYCNYGTAVAEDAAVEITLHDLLMYQDATIAPASNDGQTYTFDLGDVGINECVNFSIGVNVSCDANIGEVLCMEANVFPDTICTIPNQAWSGALLHANYTCQDDEIQFSIENVGNAAMSGPQNFIIIEDAVLLMEESINLTPAQKVEPNALPIDGSLYHLILPQEPGAPGPIWITLGADNCPNSNNAGFNQLPTYQGNPFSISFCPEVVGPYDPNDKQAYPVGYGPNHNILPDTDLQYKIRFQNVGTDTAFRVVIRDTLSQFLNPATIVPGPSSHPYDWRIGEGGQLEFIFHNINLPDSTTNLAASQGFVTYKISQQADLPEDTRIENRAGIYFDFNEPIITNTTFHTIKYWLEIIDETVSVAQPELQVNIMPNPMQHGAWIQLHNTEVTHEVLQLQLFDATGRLVKIATGNDGKIWLERGNLTAGMYFFSIESGGAWQASGKILVD